MTYYPTPDHAMNHPRHSTGENTPDAAAVLSGPDYFLCDKYNCRMSHSACTMRRRVARQQDEEGKDVTFSKCLDCTEQEVPVEKVCMVEGCNKKITARGRCSTHYAQYRSEIQKRGRVPVVGEGARECNVEGCNNPVKARGLCKTHYYRDYIAGKFDSTIIAPAEPANRPARITEKKPTTKRVNVQFSGPDVALWEKLKAQARKNRRDLRTECLVIIENALTVFECAELD